MVQVGDRVRVIAAFGMAGDTRQVGEVLEVVQLQGGTSRVELPSGRRWWVNLGEEVEELEEFIFYTIIYYDKGNRVKGIASYADERQARDFIVALKRHPAAYDVLYSKKMKVRI